MTLVGIVLSPMGAVNGLTITATLAVLLVSFVLWTMVRPSRYPPGPRGLPIVGNIFDMTDSPEVLFSRWAKQYGDIFGLKMGQRWMVVLTGQDIIKETVIQRGIDFAGRPDLYSAELITENFKDIGYSSYSEEWKVHRKLAQTALRHFATGKPLQNLLSSVYPKVEKELATIGGKPVDPKNLLTLIVSNIISQMCFGKSYEMSDPVVIGFIKAMKELKENFGMGLAGDYFLWAKYIPTSGPRMIMKAINKVFAILRAEQKEADEKYDPDNIDNMCSLLRKAQEDAKSSGENVESLSDERVFQTLHDVFQAGTQTTVDSLNWTIALMAENPAIQARVQAEVDKVVGRGRLPTIEDREAMPYTEATLFEVLRYSTIAPVGMPHSTMRDVEVRDYVIPKGAMVMMNVYAMHFDPKEWEQPEEFRPEHFLDDSGAVRQQHSSFFPFGAGRRICLGEAVAKANLFLIFTWFLQNYTVSKVPGKESESLISTIPKTAMGRILCPYEIIVKSRE